MTYFDNMPLSKFQSCLVNHRIERAINLEHDDLRQPKAFISKGIPPTKNYTTEF